MAGSGLLSRDIRLGNRSEYYAQVLLSGLGLCSPVPRQEDIGFDFHCALSRPVGSLLAFTSPFLVSVKSLTMPEIKVEPTKTVIKGGGKEHIEWLFSQQMPMFLGVVDKDAFSISLFSLSPLWWIAFHLHEDCGSIVIKPRLGAQDNRHVGAPVKGDELENWPGKFQYVVDVGHPVAVVTLDTLRDPDHLDAVKSCLHGAIEFEQRNYVHRALEIPYFYWFAKTFAGGGNFVPAYSCDAAPEPAEGQLELLRAISPGLLSFALRYTKSKDAEKLAAVKVLLRDLPAGEVPTEIRKELPDIFP